LLESIYPKDLVKTNIYLMSAPELKRDGCKLNNSMMAVASDLQFSTIERGKFQPSIIDLHANMMSFKMILSHSIRYK
jgi:hypothetical protein